MADHEVDLAGVIASAAITESPSFHAMPSSTKDDHAAGAEVVDARRWCKPSAEAWHAVSLGAGAIGALGASRGETVPGGLPPPPGPSTGAAGWEMFTVRQSNHPPGTFRPTPVGGGTFPEIGWHWRGIASTHGDSLGRPFSNRDHGRLRAVPGAGRVSIGTVPGHVSVSVMRSSVIAAPAVLLRPRGDSSVP